MGQVLTKNIEQSDYDEENIMKLIKRCKKGKDTLELAGLKKSNYLVSELCESKYCKIDSILELIDTLEDVLTLKRKSRLGAIRPGNIGEELHESNRAKYNPYKETDNIVRLIDTDIIPELDLSKACCNLIYDVIYNDYLGNNAYDVIAIHYNHSQNIILKKAFIRSAIRGFETVITNIKSHIEKYEKHLVEIYIPFIYNYCRSAKYLLDIFYSALDIAKLIDSHNNDTLDLINPNDVKALGGVEIALANYERFLAKENDSVASLVVYNERINRKHISGTKDPNTATSYRDYFTDSKFFEKQKQKEEQAKNNEKDARKNLYDKKIVRTGVLLCMLKSGGLIENELTKKIIHFSLDCRDNVWGQGRSSSIDYLRKLDSTVLTYANEESIKQFLKEYDISEDIISTLPKSIK